MLLVYLSTSILHHKFTINDKHKWLVLIQTQKFIPNELLSI